MNPRCEITAVAITFLASVQLQSVADQGKSKIFQPPLGEESLEYLSSGVYVSIMADAGRVTLPGPEIYAASALQSAAAVVLDPKVGPNIQMGTDPAELGSMHHQAEPHLVRSPVDPNLIVGTFQEGRFTNGGAVNCGYAVSHDGGETWVRALIPGLTTVSGGPYNRATDPVAGIDLDGNIYLQNLAATSTSGFSNAVLTISKSTDGGATFGDPVEVFRPANFGEWFPDKNWMAINTFPGTPTEGRIVVTHTKFPGPQEIYSQFSDDQGATWTAPQAITETHVQGSQPVFLPNGALAVVYWNFSSAISGGNSIEIVTSADGGETWGNAVLVVGNLATYNAPTVRDARFLPAATVDRENGHIFVTYQARNNGLPRIMFTRSRDGGQTWSTPVPVSDSPNDAAVFNPAIGTTSDGQHVSIIYYDRRHDTDSGDDATSLLVDLYLAESFDGGETWGSGIRLSDISTNARWAVNANGLMLGDYQAIVPALSLDIPAVAIWIDTRTCTPDPGMPENLVCSPDPFAVSIDRTSGTNVDVWKKLNFTDADLTNDSVSGDFADPDGDGLVNILEYLFALHPRRASAIPLTPVFTAFASVAHAGAGPAIGGGGTSEITISYRRRNVTDDVDAQWKKSTDFNTWNEVTPIAEQFIPYSDPNFESVETSFDAQSDPEAFFRLEVKRAL